MAFLHAVSSGTSATKSVLKGKSLTPYLLLAPGLIWLVTFFIIPIFSLASTSTMVRPDGAQVGVYEQKLRFANYVDAFLANKEQYLRSFVYAAFATLLALAIAYPLAYAIAGDYVNAAILGNPGTKMIGNVIESRFFAVVDYPTAAALSFTLMATILILVTLYIRKSGTDELV